MSHPTLRKGAKNPENRTQGGFTLVELLVAMTLSLLLLGMAFTLFQQLYNLSETTAAMAATNQNIRGSINLLARDLIASGSGIPAGGIPLPNGTHSVPVQRPGPGTNIFPASPGSAVNTFPTANAVFSVLTPGPGLGPTVIPGQPSDEITIIGIDTTSGFSQCPITTLSTDGTLATVASSCPVGTGATRVFSGDLIMLTNSSSAGSALGMVTNVDSANNRISFASGDTLQLNQPTAAGGNIAALWTPGTPPTLSPTVGTKIAMISYYLDNSGSQPRLMRQVGDAAPNPVAQPVTALQFSYNLSDGSAPGQRTVATPNIIRTVNLLVSSRSDNPLRKTRQFFVNTMTTSVSIRNLEYRNRYQP